jgi:hypothetical protein
MEKAMAKSGMSLFLRFIPRTNWTLKYWRSSQQEKTFRSPIDLSTSLAEYNTWWAVVVAVSPVAAVLVASTAVIATLVALAQLDTIAQIHHQLVTILVLLERTVGVVRQVQQAVLQDITTPLPVNLVSSHVLQGHIVRHMECHHTTSPLQVIIAPILEWQLTTHALRALTAPTNKP